MTLNQCLYVCVLSVVLILGQVSSEAVTCNKIYSKKIEVFMNCCVVEDVNSDSINFSDVNTPKETFYTRNNNHYRCSEVIKSKKVPNFDNRRFANIPGRCPHGTTFDIEGRCVEIWE
ncbi:hypothetical protein WA026_009333 [Henosepilachna vigintioctopunctata]|uniref:Uncharacterized protein n=1 Tax=Henosepilachna vigintioctopunctata TaxID=420089 RepID=A0AAW1UW91_9CUCU